MSTERRAVRAITPRSEDFSAWYTDVVTQAELADYAPVRGCMVIRPYGYRLWELLQGELDRRFKATGVVNAYFPLFIPESIFRREAEHVAGFSPEVPWVTEVGDEKLAERLVVRPTSETIIGTMFAKWIQSYRDLPLVINQWCNVVRWEKRTLPFLRTTEFLWQEGHTAHRDEQDARERTLLMWDVYRRFYEEVLAVPVVAGRKSESEKFAGAVETYTVEALMGDGRALQGATSHYLGEGFARVFEIRYLDADGQLKYCHTTSWGLSTRAVGAVIMVHGDDRGLRLPPCVAPVQVVIVPIMPEAERERVLPAARDLADRLRGLRCRTPRLGEFELRVHLDDRVEHTPGWKFNEWELRGVPLRLELGPRELAEGRVVVARRDTLERVAVPEDALQQRLPELLDEVQGGLLRQAREFLSAHTHEPEAYEEFRRLMAERRGFAVAAWCGDAECERRIKEDTGATIRCLPVDGGAAAGACIGCGREARARAYFARAY